MVKRALKRVMLWVTLFYLVSALGFSYGTQISHGRSGSALTIESVQAGLSWPWLMVRAASERRS